MSASCEAVMSTGAAAAPRDFVAAALSERPVLPEIARPPAIVSNSLETTAVVEDTFPLRMRSAMLCRIAGGVFKGVCCREMPLNGVCVPRQIVPRRRASACLKQRTGVSAGHLMKPFYTTPQCPLHRCKSLHHSTASFNVTEVPNFPERGQI
jgi:hypothetical protein